jgi:anti-anti-sigma factor
VRPPPTLSVSTDKVGDADVFAIVGEVDLSNTEEIHEPLVRCTANGATRLLIDLSRCTFIDSTAIAALVRARDALRAKQPGSDPLVIATGTGHVARILHLVGIGDAIPLVASRAEGLARLASPLVDAPP